MSLRQTGLEGDGRLTVWPCLHRQAEVQQELAQIGPCGSGTGIKLDGPAQMLQCPLIFPQGVQGGAQVRVGHWVVGSRSQRRQKCAGRLFISLQGM